MTKATSVDAATLSDARREDPARGAIRFRLSARPGVALYIAGTAVHGVPLAQSRRTGGDKRAVFRLAEMSCPILHESPR